MDVPGEVWVALITGGFLLAQQWRSDRREDRRIKADRDAREEDRKAVALQRDEDRKGSLDEHWRDERRITYAQVIALLNEIVELAGSIRHAEMADPELREESPKRQFNRLREASDEVRKPLATAELIGTEAVRRSTVDVQRAVLRVALSALVAEMGAKDSGIRLAADELHEQSVAFMNVARVDLGTAWSTDP